MWVGVQCLQNSLISVSVILIRDVSKYLFLYEYQAYQFKNIIQASIIIIMHKRDIQQLSKIIAEANESITHALTAHHPTHHQPTPPTTTPHTHQHPAKHPLQMQAHEHTITTHLEQLSIFDKIEDHHIEENIEGKITNLKLTQFSQRRKDEFFKRYKKDQEQKFTSKKKELEKTSKPKQPQIKLIKGEFVLKDEKQNKTQTFPINEEDMDKLKPETDLNDTIIGNYLKLLGFVYLPNQESIYIYSSFFLSKLIPDYTREEIVYDKDPASLVILVREKVKENYKNVKRWTRRIDIFEKETVVFPINAFHHWFCVIVNNPKQLLTAGGKCQLIYCDSMLQKKQFILESIRKYLQYELQDKKGIKLQLNDVNVPSYQLLLPRQTNTHDCGLYMMAYIEELLLNSKELKNMSLIPNRKKLRLFPRTLIYKMRERLKKLFYRLINAKDDAEKNDILVQYKSEKQNIMKEEKQGEFDSINQREFRKYQKMNLVSVLGSSLEQRSYACEIKFYLDPEINFYQKDK